MLEAHKRESLAPAKHVTCATRFFLCKKKCFLAG